MATGKVFLEISCWRGVSLGAEHYYGSLTSAQPYRKVELTKVITEEEAAALNDKDRCEFPLYSAGDTSERFDSEAEVRATALREWQKHFPGAEILFCGSSCYADPTEILIAPEPIFAKGNELYNAARHIGFWDFNEEKMQEIAAEWDLLFKEHGY